MPGHVWSPSAPGRVSCEACSEAMDLDAVEAHTLSTRHEVNVKNLYTLLHTREISRIQRERDELSRYAQALRESVAVLVEDHEDACGFGCKCEVIGQAKRVMAGAL